MAKRRTKKYNRMNWKYLQMPSKKAWREATDTLPDLPLLAENLCLGEERQNNAGHRNSPCGITQNQVFLFVCFIFLPHPWHREVPGPGIRFESKVGDWTYAVAGTVPDPLPTVMGTPIGLLSFFFFWPHLWHAKVSRPGIQPPPQQPPKLLQWRHILNLLNHGRTPHVLTIGD